MNSVMKKNVIVTLIISMVCGLFACSPYKKEQVLCDYPMMECLYYTKDTYKEYRYKDFIVDDISNGEWKKASPNIADYKTGKGLLDYDIQGYVNAKMDYSIKEQMIARHELEIDSFCQQVRDDTFKQRNSYIYYYDKKSKKSKLLYDGPVTNITYDDETPIITFDVNEEQDKDVIKWLKGKKIHLSDVIAANTTIDGFMKVILGSGKKKMAFFMDKLDENKENTTDFTNNIS